MRLTVLVFSKPYYWRIAKSFRYLAQGTQALAVEDMYGLCLVRQGTRSQTVP